ncbi:TIGR02099 family protein [Vibrio astriarenae]|uniref:TIGR02099 family protein n=1 Tax=Vibrio astriarenae TaxID=1481923 RepID=A0A7Z2YEN4_9VIBR|nr:YhdP family protein [Vibrio astriarenae]QIA64295.1 TIGR02099 family protein [Vibrio astriarenae]
MSKSMTRLWHCILWLLVSAMVILAIAVTALRVTLPKLNHFQTEIHQFVNQYTGLDLEIEDVRGYWLNTHPSISLQSISVDLPAASNIHMSAERLDIEFDLIQSVLALKPIIAELNVHGLHLDLQSIDLFGRADKGEDQSASKSNSGALSQVEQLFLRQLDDFSLYDSKVAYVAIDGEFRELEINKLRWNNEGKRHRGEGVVSIADAYLSELKVSADFYDHGSLRDVSGEFYVQADSMSIGPWLTEYLQAETGIQSGQLSFATWLTLSNSKPVDAYLELMPSDLTWIEGEQHELLVESGIFKLFPLENGLKVSGHSLNIRTDDTEWPELDLAFDITNQGWRLNISELDISAVAPLTKLLPDSESTSEFLSQLAPKGQVEDLRISMSEGIDTLAYSADLFNVGITQWGLLPGVNKANIAVSGDAYQAKATLSLFDDVLPYGDVFQAPLNVRQAHTDIVWQRDDSGWSLWSDKVTAATPDIQVLGAFRLDFPQDQSPFLSFYAEADLFNAGQTWRYLPTLALGQGLTDYLSTSIQGGRVETAKLLWYGELGDFPYQQNNGIFQAWVGLEDAKYSFETSWPLLTDLQLDLLFENESMYLDSRSATLMDLKASRVTGRIPSLSGDGHIEIEAQASGPGPAVRDYMTASPLVDSVGAALTAIDVQGDVEASFQLNIPFSDDGEARAWGKAELKDNHVTIDAPPMILESVSGSIEFDNDVVTSAGLEAQLLKQPVSIDFVGENAGRGYAVDIDVIGDWEVDPLLPYIGARWLDPLSGNVPWHMGIDIQLNDVGFTYQIDGEANLKQLASTYPYPLDKPKNQAGSVKLQASGNQQMVSARLELPRAKYQAEIDIRPDRPVLNATHLVVGNGSFKISPIAGHTAQVRSPRFNLDEWMSISEQEATPQVKVVIDELNTPAVPVPQRIDLDVKTLTFAKMDWHDVNFGARKKGSDWTVTLDSQQAKGRAKFENGTDLSVSLEHLNIYVPGLDEALADEPTLIESMDADQPLISDADRQLHQAMPNIDLTIDDFWMQGYKLGKVNVDLHREGDTLDWKSIKIESGSNQIDISSQWTLTQDQSYTKLKVDIKGDNNSDVMERFGISSGIQQAPFELQGQTRWDGAPWSMKVDTLQGDARIKLGKGIISDVSGAARLLGMFSLDSIIRKMQLDFTDVFDRGMAFNSITGNGQFRNGIFLTNDIKMDAIAGEMRIKGIANLNDQTVDAEVNFTPDITSGIPVLTAFAVTPQTALYVLAITTVVSPIVEVFTQVNYEVKGPFDSPIVQEISRSQGEFALPEELRAEADK